MTKDMNQLQGRQVRILREQLELPGEQGRLAAIRLAQLVKQNSTPISDEALEAFLEVLASGKQVDSRKWAAWALGALANVVTAYDLSERIVPALIQVLSLNQTEMPDVIVAGQAYRSLMYIGTPDAVAAVEAYRAKVLNRRKDGAVT
jgi:hypothetical protein